MNGAALQRIHEIKRLVDEVKQEVERMENGIETTLWYIREEGT